MIVHIKCSPIYYTKSEWLFDPWNLKVTSWNPTLPWNTTSFLVLEAKIQKSHLSTSTKRYKKYLGFTMAPKCNLNASNAAASRGSQLHRLNASKVDSPVSTCLARLIRCFKTRSMACRGSVLNCIYVVCHTYIFDIQYLYHGVRFKSKSSELWDAVCVGLCGLSLDLWLNLMRPSGWLCTWKIPSGCFLTVTTGDNRDPTL